MPLPAARGVDLSSPPEEPTTIRVGHGRAAEEPFWLMTVMEDLTEYQGDWYDLELQPFRGTEERLQAYQAGDLDAVVVSPQAQIRGTAAGALDLVAVGTIMREAEPDAFSTSFLSLEGSGIESVEDLEGASIAVVDIGSQLDFLAKAGVRQGGFDPDTAAQYVVFPFPAQEEALRGGQVDVIGLPEPFYTLAKQKRRPHRRVQRRRHHRLRLRSAHLVLRALVRRGEPRGGLRMAGGLPGGHGVLPEQQGRGPVRARADRLHPAAGGGLPADGRLRPPRGRRGPTPRGCRRCSTA